jgi:hypothetical protein
VKTVTKVMPDNEMPHSCGLSHRAPQVAKFVATRQENPQKGWPQWKRLDVYVAA